MPARDRLDPELADAYNFLGYAYHNLNRLAAAELSYRHAIDLNPDDADAHQNLAAALFRLEKFDEAMKHTEIARELGIDPLKLQMTLGDILWAKGDLAGALDAFRMAIRFDLHRAYSRMLFNMSSSPAFEPQEWVAEARRYGEHLERDALPFEHDRAQRVARRDGRCASASCRATYASIRSASSLKACWRGSTGRASSHMRM